MGPRRGVGVADSAGRGGERRRKRVHSPGQRRTGEDGGERETLRERERRGEREAGRERERGERERERERERDRTNSLQSGAAGSTANRSRKGERQRWRICRHSTAAAAGGISIRQIIQHVAFPTLRRTGIDRPLVEEIVRNDPFRMPDRASNRRRALQKKKTETLPSHRQVGAAPETLRAPCRTLHPVGGGCTPLYPRWYQDRQPVPLKDFLYHRFIGEQFPPKRLSLSYIYRKQVPLKDCADYDPSHALDLADASRMNQMHEAPLLDLLHRCGGLLLVVHVLPLCSVRFRCLG